jgi:hypothetical protein
MRFRILMSLMAAAFLLGGCGGGTAEKKAEVPVKKKSPVADETHHFPAEGRVEARVVEDHVLGREFLPGGNVAHYRRGKQEFDMFLIRTSAPEAAALLLFDYKKRMENPKLIAHFGGYYGKDGGQMVFVFAKGPWVAGVAGLDEKDADMAARELAARLN